MNLEHSPARAGDAPVGHPNADAPEPDRLIGEAECKRISGLSRTTRWWLEKCKLFPARRRLSPNRVGWLLSEIQSWLRAREVVT